MEISIDATGMETMYQDTELITATDVRHFLRILITKSNMKQTLKRILCSILGHKNVYKLEVLQAHRIGVEYGQCIRCVNVRKVVMIYEF